MDHGNLRTLILRVIDLMLIKACSEICGNSGLHIHKLVQQAPKWIDIASSHIKRRFYRHRLSHMRAWIESYLSQISTDVITHQCPNLWIRYSLNKGVEYNT